VFGGMMIDHRRAATRRWWEGTDRKTAGRDGPS
jgi:hypothetical protein